MADVGEQLIVYLRTQAGVTTLTGTSTNARILQQSAPKESTLDPTVCVTITNDEAIDHLGGDSVLRRADVQLVGFANTIGSRNALAAAIGSAMDAVTSSIGSIAVAEVNVMAGRSDGELVEYVGADHRLYTTAFVYRIWHYAS